MNPLINNFTLHQRICNIHSEPCTFISLQNSPHRMKLICNRCFTMCSKFNNENTKYIYYLSTVIVLAETKMNQQAEIVDIRKIIRDKKQEIEKKQFKTLELVMKKLTQQKQTLFMELDLLERAYSNQQNRYAANLQQRSQITKYLKQFSLDQQLLKLKLIVSNQYGLNSFLAQIKTLQMLSQQYPNRSSSAVINELNAEIVNRQGSSFANKLQSLFKKSIQQIANGNLQKLRPKQKYYYNNQATQRTQRVLQRRNQSQQNLALKSPRTSRQTSFAQLPKLVIS